MFKYFKVFRSVYENLNFSLAANQLFITQSSVSQQIKKLETILNGKLFIRHSRSEILPTPLAKKLYKSGLEIFENAMSLEKKLKLDQTRKVICKIGVSNTVSDVCLSNILKQIQFPDNVEFKINLSNSTKITEKLANHQLDFGFIEKPILAPNIIRIPFFQDNLVQAGNSNNPTWLERENGSGVHYYTEEFFKQKNKKPKNIITVNNNGLIIRMLENDIGQSIISEHVLTNNINYSKLGEHFKRNFYFLERHEYGFEELNKLAYQFKISIKNIKKLKS